MRRTVGKMEKACNTCQTEFMARIDEHQRGLGKYCSRKCYFISKKGKLPSNLKVLHATHRGENASNWQGGRCAVNALIRSSARYKQWRKAVYERDRYTCVWCKAKGNGRNLNADHIKPFSIYLDLRFDIDNGRTLCISCHRKTDTYGKRIVNYQIL